MTEELTHMPSATGVRIAGDRYQWLHAWSACLDLLEDLDNPAHTNPGVAVGIEVPGIVPLDDVVYFRQHEPHIYKQVKWAVDSTSPVNLAYVSQKDLLRRLRERWTALKTTAGEIEIVLVSTREVDPADELASRRDSRTGKLVPRGSEMHPVPLRDSRKAWADAAGATEETLLELLGDLRFETGVDLPRLVESVRLKMRASGLRAADIDIEAAISWIERNVVAGRRHIELATVVEYADTMRRSEPWSRISVATILPDPDARTARAAVDWTDRMDGAGEAHAAISPRKPHTWDDLARDLDGLAAAVEPAKRILVSGHMRQATGFYVGAIFRRVLNFEIAVPQGASLWTSSEKAIRYDPEIEVIDLGSGEEVAMLTCVSAEEAVDAVRLYLKENVPTVGKLLIVRPPQGITGKTAIPDASSAAAYAQAALSQARVHSPEKLTFHLFEAGPLGVAVLLGHYWNRVAPTIVYEHLGRARYEPAFHVPG